MSVVVNFIKDVFTSLWDAFTDIVKVVWDVLVEPILEEIFSWFGIEDETIISVQRISSRVFSNNTKDVYEAGVAKAVLSMVMNDQEFFPNYMQQIFKVKGQLRSYFRYGELDLFWNGLPEMEVNGTFVSFENVQFALDSTFGSTHTVLSAIDRNPTRFQFYFFEMKTTHNYKAWLNTLTFTDTLQGVERDGWNVDDIVLNVGPNDYTIDLSREMETAEFFIYGPDQITEGETATYTIRSNREIPSGFSVPITFSYAGTAVDGVDFNEVASVTMLEETDEITVDLVTLDTGNAGRTIAMTIATLDNGFAATTVFEHVNINVLDTVTTTITDDDTLLLTMSDQLVIEADTTITIDVKLGLVAPSGAFDVDYNFTDLGGITGGVDYDNTTGTLNFAGTADEVQQISIDIFADILDDDLEQFEVFLENSTDVDGIDISAVAKVTILDKTSDPTPGTTLITDSFIKTPAFVKESSIIVVYSDDYEPPGQFHYWVHPHSDPTYNLRAVHRSIRQLEMMPLAIIRKNKTQWNVLYGPTDTEFFTTRMLFARIGLDLDDFLNATGSNPDISEIDDAYLNFSVSPSGTNKLESKMLWLQFEQLVITSGLQSNVDALSVTIKEGDINNAIVWSNHTIEFARPGQVTTTGDYTHSRSGNDLTLQYQKVDGFYDQILLETLNGMTAIDYGGFHEVALNNLDDDNFTVPISWKIWADVNAREQMEVFQYLCRLDFHAVTITHLEWYETSAFFDLFEFVLTVISVIFIFVAFLAVGFLALIQQLVVQWAIGELIIFIAEATGSVFFAAIAAVAIAYFTKDGSSLEKLFAMSGEELLNLASDYADTFTDAYVLAEGDKVAKRIEEQQLALNEMREQLDAAEEAREDVSALENLDIPSSGLPSVDNGSFAAIQAQYNYDTLYNYDNIVGNYHTNQLQTGIGS